MNSQTGNQNGGHDSERSQKAVDFGNTLDYYNDDMSRRAVGKLFEGAGPKPEGAEPPERNEMEDTGIVKGFERAGRAPAGDADDASDKQYTFSLYRKKEKRQDSSWGAYSRSGEEDNPKPIRAAQIQGRLEQNRFEPAEPTHSSDQTNTDTPNREYTKIERPARAPYQSAAKGSQRGQETRRTKAVRPPSYYNTEPDDDFEDYDDYPKRLNLTPRTIVAAASAFAAIVIMAVLIFMLNAANGRLAEADDLVASYEALERTNGVLKMDLEAAQAEIDSLTVRLNDAEGQLYALNPPEMVDQGGPGGENAPDGGGTPPAGGTTHVVQSGETLGAIAQQHYGNASLFALIQQANGLTGSNISVGQTLVIPPQP